MAAWKRGELTEEEFSEKWDSLWGYDTELQSMVDRIHTACYLLRPIPEAPCEIGEQQLRSEVAEALATYTAKKTRA
jgi:hypothetical protein